MGCGSGHTPGTHRRERLLSAATVPSSIASLAGLSFAPARELVHTVVKAVGRSRRPPGAPSRACSPTLPPRTCAHRSPSENRLLHSGLQARSCPGLCVPEANPWLVTDRLPAKTNSNV